MDDLLGELAKQANDAYEVGVLEPWIECSKNVQKSQQRVSTQNFPYTQLIYVLSMYVIFYMI